MSARSELAPVHHKSYKHPCLIAQTLDVLGDRWTLLILRDLMSGLHRYSDILDSCGGMSPNVLSDRLKRLEASGLVERQYHRELPPRVEYTLTGKGWSVRPILLSLIAWGNQYLPGFSRESVGRDVPTDFAVRVIPAFAFRPERAGELAATMVIQIRDCAGCNTWSYVIRDGCIHPQRNTTKAPDVRLLTDTGGFFRFIRGEAPPAECGEIEGDLALALAIQSCFLAVEAVS